MLFNYISIANYNFKSVFFLELSSCWQGIKNIVSISLTDHFERSSDFPKKTFFSQRSPFLKLIITTKDHDILLEEGQTYFLLEGQERNFQIFLNF